VRILLVEDDDALRSALRAGLAEKGFAVDASTTAEEAADLLAVEGYDALVLDLGLPRADGLALLHDVRGKGAPLPVLILTARGSIQDRVAGLEAGADDYLVKPFAFPELVARLRALLRRGPAVVPTVLQIGDIELDPDRLVVRRRGERVEVTVKEFAILECLMRHAGELVTRTMLLERCWDASYEGLSNLVDVHVSRLRRKLDLDRGSPALRTIRGAGFVLSVA
jgi:two-component system OmpR family response regulator